jgi:cyanate permease
MIVAVGATVAVSLPVFLLGAVFVQLGEDVQAPAWSLGVLVAVFWAAAALASAFAGELDRRIGSRRLTLVSLGVVVLASTGFALAGGGWAALVVWTVLGGLASGVQHPATNSLITVNVGEHRRGLAFGVKQCAVPLATLAAGMAIPLVAIAFSWRWAFVGAAVFSVVVLVFYAALGRADGAVRKRMRTVVRMPVELARTFSVLSVVAFAGGATVTATTAYLVVAAVGRGMDQATAGVVLAVASGFGASARAALGAVVDRYRGASVAMAALLILVSGVAAVGIAYGPLSLLAIGAMLGSGLAGAWSGLLHYFVARTAGPFAAAATGRIQFGSFVGCAVGPVAFGGLSAFGMPELPWLMLAVLGIGGGVVGLFVARRPPQPLSH